MSLKLRFNGIEGGIVKFHTVWQKSETYRGLFGQTPYFGATEGGFSNLICQIAENLTKSLFGIKYIVFAPLNWKLFKFQFFTQIHFKFSDSQK